MKLRSRESYENVSEGGGDITIVKFGFGSEAYEIWKEHYLPGGKVPDVVELRSQHSYDQVVTLRAATNRDFAPDICIETIRSNPRKTRADPSLSSV
jgi:hypothetical protein